MNNNANRGRIRPWREHEDEYLKANYATVDTVEIAKHMRRSVASIYRRANRLGLEKQNQTKWKPGAQVGVEYRFKPGHTVGPRFAKGNTYGKKFAPGNIPHNKGTGKPRESKQKRTPKEPKATTNRLVIWERCAALFDKYRELKQKDMQRILGLRSGSVSNALSTRPAGLFHIDRWVQVGRNFEAVYVKGQGYDAEKPNKEIERERERVIRLEKPDRIPQPVSWLWGMPVETDYRKAA